MLEKELSKKILVVGIDYKVPRGGIAAVLNVYSTFFERFKFLPTVVEGDKSKFVKLFVAVMAFAKLPFILIFDRDIRIVHIHSSADASFWRKRIVAKVSKALGKKVIFHIHAGRMKTFRDANKEKVDEILHLSDVVVGLSQEWKDYYESIGCTNVVTIKNVIGAPVIKPMPKDEKIHFLFLGLIGDNKGIYDVLETLREHHSEASGKIMFHIGGNGETKKLTDMIAKYKLDDIVKFEGWVDKEKKVNLFNQADVMLLTSYKEGVPITLLEAMSYHLPVITTPVGGIPSIVTDRKNGLLVEPGNKEQIWAAIKEMMDKEKERKEYGKAGYSISKEYLPDTIERQLRELYTSLLK